MKKQKRPKFTPLEDYKLCVVCKKPLKSSIAEIAVRRMERMNCGKDKCGRANEIRLRMICCELADYINCSCVRAYFCPIHGEVHVGSHD